jgi:hypothetical protein
MEAKQKQTDEYSLIVGGLFRKVQVKLGVGNHQGVLALAGVCFAWLPLVILTALDGTLYTGANLPFLKDIAFHARLLIALPVLILVRNNINIKTTAVTRYMANSLLDGEGRQKMIDVTIPRMQKLACSSLTEIVLILIVLGSVLGLAKSGAYTGLLSDSTSWKFVGLPEDNMMSLAGKWAFFISVPFFQFLLIQWIWRYIVWMMLLFSFTKAGLKLLPTHADRSGGLSILIFAQRSFSFVFMAGSLVISGQLMVYILNSHEAIKMIQGVVIGYLILSIIILMLPLLFFIGKLVRTKQLGLLHLSQLATEMSERFEGDWLNDKPFEKRVAERQVDPSMAYDYASMYDNLQQLRIVPVTVRDIIGIALSIAIPFVPILFVYFSAAEVLSKIIGLLL